MSVTRRWARSRATWPQGGRGGRVSEREGGREGERASEALMGDESCVAAAVCEGVEAWTKG